jgi:hypothetical protein
MTDYSAQIATGRCPSCWPADDHRGSAPVAGRHRGDVGVHPRAAAGARPASWLSGTWMGPASQPTGKVTRWEPDLSFSRSGRTGTFRFPTLGCSGKLVMVRISGRAASARQDMTVNPRRLCVPDGLLRLREAGGEQPGHDMAGPYRQWQCRHRPPDATAVSEPLGTSLSSAAWVPRQEGIYPAEPRVRSVPHGTGLG